MLVQAAPRARTCRVPLAPPSHTAVVSWHASAPSGRIELRVERMDGAVSDALPYVEFTSQGRRSLCGADGVARIAVDVVESDVPIVAITVSADVELATVAVSTPEFGERRSPQPHRTALLDVPALSQYDFRYPAERGWCSAAALTMLLAYWSRPHELCDVAAAVYDERYGGTGNWALNIAYANRCGLAGIVTHLADLDHAARFIAAGIPLGLSFAWTDGMLPGAPIAHSAGHFAVLRGFDAAGDAQCNDPAQAALVACYDRRAFERAWLDHGGIAYALAPLERRVELERLVNA